MADVDNRPIWFMGIFLVCYTTFLVCCVVGHPGYGVLILVGEIFVGDRIYGAIKLKAIRIGTGSRWFRIWWLFKPVRQFDEKKSLEIDQDEAGEYIAYELDDSVEENPRLLTTSHDEVERLFLSNDVMMGMWGELSKRMSTTYSTNSASRVVTEVLKPGQVMHDLALSVHQVNLDDYELEYFRERRLSAHVSPKVYKFLRKRNVNLETFMTYGQTFLHNLQVEIHERIKENIDLVQIQRYLRHSFTVYFTEREIDFFKKRGCRTLGDLSRSNLDQLEREFNIRYAKTRALAKLKTKIEHVPIARYVHELEEEIAKTLSRIIHELTTKDYADYIRALEIAMLEANPGSYIYEVRFKRVVPIDIMDGNDVLSTIETKTIYIEFPAPLDDAVKDEVCTMYPLGIPVKVQTSSTMQLAHRDMLTWDRPVFYCTDCTYWREHGKNKARAGVNDKYWTSIVKAIAKLFDDTSAEVRKSLNLFVKAQSTIAQQHSTINNQRALDLDAENVQETIDREKERIKARLAPKGDEKPVFWVLSIVLLIVGLIIGFYAGLTLGLPSPVPLGGG